MLSRIYKSHLRSLIRLSIPIISGQIGWVLMGFADNIMVSKVGYVSLAAAGITNSVFFLVTIFSMGVLMVVPTIVAEKMHPGSKHTLRSLQQETQWLSQILGIITFGILMLVYFNFDLLDQETAVENEAKPYFLVVAISSFPNLWFMASKNLCDGYQKTSAPMVITFAALLLNIILNWIFIFGHGVQPMGLLGAGYATLISRIFMAVTITIYMNKNLSIPGNQYKSLSVLPFGKWLHLRQILKLGVPSGFQYFFEVAAFALAGIMAGWLGAKELAAHQIGITLSSLTYMFALGISTASSIIIGNAFSKRNLPKTESAGITALGLITVIMIIFSLAFGIFRSGLAKSFSDEWLVVEFTTGILLIAAVYQIFDGVQGVALGVLRGMRDVKVPLVFTLIAYWGISIPLGYWLAFEKELGIYGIWYGLTAGLFCSAIFLSLRFKKLIVNSKNNS
jgi:MATE family multidrug resistance protein